MEFNPSPTCKPELDPEKMPQPLLLAPRIALQWTTFLRHKTNIILFESKNKVTVLQNAHGRAIQEDRKIVI